MTPIIHAIGQWQPIETAPKDGKPILLTGDRANAMYARSAFWADEPYGANWYLDDGENCFVHGIDAKPIVIHEPKYWMLQPNPPEAV